MMKKITAYFIKHPIAINIITIAIILLGFTGYRSLKSSFFPLVKSKRVKIKVKYSASSPRQVEEGITLKIENNLKGIPGIDRITSVSSESYATIYADILNGYDINNVLIDIKNAIDKVPKFPSGVEPPVISKVENVNEAINFVITGKNLTLKDLKKATESIENELRLINGISQIKISGYPNEEIEIAVRESDLTAYNLTFNQVAKAVTKTNILKTGGTIKTESENYLIRAKDRAYYGDELGNVVVKANADGSFIRIKDIATVNDQFKDNPNKVYYNGNLAVNVKISNTNNEDLISSVKKLPSS